ncbi:MAG: protein-export chaperone SecB [Alphaproteobacteria bacterium]|nr:protein-export chaperone SecB [Alphaproteobacteria bacterium]
MENNENNQPGMLILSQYIKDMSIEIPLAPEIFGEITDAPHVDVDISMTNRQIKGNNYEVLLNTKINADTNGKKVFIIELSYGAVATLNLPEEALEPVLYIELPRLIFPFVRTIVANSLQAAGLPPILLSPIDFVSMYQAKKAQEEADKTEKKA